MKKIPVIAVVGPTASGKTALSINIAKRFSGQVVSADSMQIYEKMNIATAKPTEEEMQGIPHHLIGFQPIDKKFSVAEYVQLANECIHKIHNAGDLPVETTEDKRNYRKFRNITCALIVGISGAGSTNIVYADMRPGSCDDAIDVLRENGLLEEAEEFYNISADKTACQAIGYKELAPYFRGDATLEDCVEKLKLETRHYAKRQLTWFRKNENVNWVYPDDYENTQEMYIQVFSMINDFLRRYKNEDENQ